MKLFAPSDALMRLMRKMTSLKMIDGSSTDEFALLVRDTYRRIYAEATRMCLPNVDINTFIWECLQLGILEDGLTL